MAFIKIENLTYYYPEEKIPAIENINLEIEEGEFVLIAGSSGCGKSTLLKSIPRLIPDFYGGSLKGKIYIENEDIINIEKRRLVQKTGIVFQNPESQLLMTEIDEEIAFGLENLELSDSLMKRRMMEVTSALSISDCKERFIPELSGGQKQKVALASVLSMHPKILLLDEPTSQLDPVAGEEILTMVRRLNEENGVTVILSEQKLERCFHLADRFIIMKDGKIVKNTKSITDVSKWSVENNFPFIPPISKIFADTGSREIPSTVKEGRKIIRPYVKNIDLPEDKNSNSEKKEKIAEIKELWFSYPEGNEVLKKINIEIEKGKFSVILGENGSGKTTLIKMMAGLLKPCKGNIIINGESILKKEIEEITELVGYLPQNPNDFLFMDTVREEILYTVKKRKLENDINVDEILRKLDILSMKDKNPRDLSTGERQRVALASLLVTKPEILLLDEPTRGLDYELKEKLGNILQEFLNEGNTIIMVSHDIEFIAEYADEVLFLDNGMIIDNGNKYNLLSESTFYSSQISKLFNGYINNIVTFEQGRKILEKILYRNME